MRASIIAVLALSLSACYRSPPADDVEWKSTNDIVVEKIAEERGITEQDAQAVLDADIALQHKIDAIRQADPTLNWVTIGISTGKFSEDMNSGVYRTYEECLKGSWMADNECIPIPALPDSYWNAEQAVAQ